jgi:hypothetical protein
MDICGHPPIPLAQNRVLHFGIFFTVFRVPNFRDCFEALIDVFLEFWGAKGYDQHDLTSMEVVLI